MATFGVPFRLKLVQSRIGVLRMPLEMRHGRTVDVLSTPHSCRSDNQKHKLFGKQFNLDKEHNLNFEALQDFDLLEEGFQRLCNARVLAADRDLLRRDFPLGGRQCVM